jgi:hypothetical protein
LVLRTRLVAAAIALSLAFPVAGSAEDTPWNALKKLFHEPVTEFKQQIEQLRTAAEASKQKPEPEKKVTVATEPAPEPEKAPAAPTVIPRPKEAAAAEAPKADPAIVTSAPIPRARPETAFSYAPDDPAPPKTAKAVAAIGALTLPRPSLIAPPPAARSTCGAALARLGVEASAIAPIKEGACGIAQPVAVAALGGGATDLTTKAIIECALAEKFANWLGDEVQPAARRILGGEVTGLRVAASYTCRARNGVAGAKLSEHGRGTAIDIAAFKIDGRGWVAVGGGHSGDEARFLKTVRASACGPFTTVLGPGSDSYHSDHFHLDLAERNKGGKSRGLYCH